MAGPITACSMASTSVPAGVGNARPPSTRTAAWTREGCRAAASAATNAPIEWPSRTTRSPPRLASATATRSSTCAPRPQGPWTSPAAGAPPEVGSDEPHGRAPDRRDTSSATGCQDSALAVMPCAARTTAGVAPSVPAAGRAGQVVHLQVAPGTLDPERCRHVARAHQDLPALPGPDDPRAQPNPRPQPTPAGPARLGGRRRGPIDQPGTACQSRPAQRSPRHATGFPWQWRRRSTCSTAAR